MRYGNKRFALPYFKKWLQTDRHWTFQEVEDSRSTNGSLEKLNKNKERARPYPRLRDFLTAYISVNN